MPDATLDSPASPADVPYINPDLAAAALAADPAGTGGLRLVPLAELTPDPANVRQHPERNLEAVEASLQRFGQRTPIVVQRQGMVVRAGNARLAVFKKLGWSHIAALVVDEGNVEAASYAIADNRTSELAVWDEEALARQLDALAKDGIDLDDLGFSEADLDALSAALDVGTGGDVDDPGAQDPPETPVTRKGDLWILGDHRLLCGDSTNADDVLRVLNGETARLMATDPPYLVGYDGMNHPKEHHKKAGRSGSSAAGGKHWDAYKDPATSVEFFAAFLRTGLRHLDDRAPIYQWHASKRVALVEAAWQQNNLLVHQSLVWVKSRGVLTYSHFLWKSEPCLYGWREGHQPEKDRRPPPDQTNVWEVDQAGENHGIHATQKPRELFRRPLEWHLRPGELAYEPFSGSGTQIIAAEETGRRCFAMELAPEFVDAGLRRFELATGKEAVLDGDGRTFAAVKAERLGDEDGGGTD